MIIVFDVIFYRIVLYNIFTIMVSVEFLHDFEL